jgi:hypothetical protein
MERREDKCLPAALSVLALLAVLARSLVSRVAFQACTLPSLSRFPFFDSTGLSWGLFGFKSALRGPKSAPRDFFSAPRASESAPRGSQEAFRGLPRRRCDREPILDPFLTPKSEPGTSKIKEILCTVVKNQGFAIFSSTRFRTSIWDPFGLRFGTLLALKMAETCLWIPLGAPKSRSGDLFFGPGDPQERSKRLTGEQKRA